MKAIEGKRNFQMGLCKTTCFCLVWCPSVYRCYFCRLYTPARTRRLPRTACLSRETRLRCETSSLRVQLVHNWNEFGCRIYPPCLQTASSGRILKRNRWNQWGSIHVCMLFTLKSGRSISEFVSVNFVYILSSWCFEARNTGFLKL